MRRFLSLLFVLALAACHAPAPPKRAAAPPVRVAGPADIQARVDRLAGGFQGDAGVAIVDVEQGWLIEHNGQRFYPQQSVSKVWVAMTVLEAVDQRRMALSDLVTVRPEDLSLFFQPIAEEVGTTGYTTTVSDLMRRALGQSDNAADDVLMGRVGGARGVETMLARKKLVGIRIGGDQKHLQSRVAGLEWRPEYRGKAFKIARSRVAPEVRDAALAAYLADPPDGATPVGAARAIAALARGELLSPGSTGVLLSALGSATTGPGRVRAGLDPDWFIAHKTGTGPDWRGASAGINDLALIVAPDGHRYVVAIFIAQTSAAIPDRLAFMQAVTRSVVDHWNAAHPALAGSPPPIPSATAQTDN